MWFVSGGRIYNTLLSLECLPLASFSCLVLSIILAYWALNTRWRKWSVVKTIPGIIFTTLHFLHNLWMGQINYCCFYHSKMFLSPRGLHCKKTFSCDSYWGGGILQHFLKCLPSANFSCLVLSIILAYWALKYVMKKMNTLPVIIFTTLHFLYNLWMGWINYCCIYHNRILFLSPQNLTVKMFHRDTYWGGGAICTTLFT